LAKMSVTDTRLPQRNHVPLHLACAYGSPALGAGP
jgi:hypothetical protein